jgi:hypothetical protein
MRERVTVEYYSQLINKKESLPVNVALRAEVKPREALESQQLASLWHVCFK